jgi:hypothetical protein
VAFDLFWRKRTDRDFGRSSSLLRADVPPPPPALGPSLKQAAARVAEPAQGVLVRKHGRGAVVSKRWLW